MVTDNFDKNLSYSIYVTHFDSINNKTKDISVVNNTFIPKEEGNYKITYATRDHSNNVASREIIVNSINSPQTMTLSLDTTSISQELYSNITLPSPSDVVVTGGSGRATVTRTVVDSNNKEVATNGDIFVPEKVGNYKAVYRAVDYIGNIAKLNLPIEVSDPGHPIFVGEAYLPRVLIKGHKYTLPEYSGVEVVNNETVGLTSKVYVNGTILTNRTFTAESSCLVRYELSGTRGVETYQVPIDVIDGGSPINLANYFYGDFQKEVHAEDVQLTGSTGTQHDLFASVLPYDNPNIKFAVDPNNLTFSALKFKFSDSINQNNSLTFKIRFSSEKAYISAGSDANEYEFGKSSLATGEDSFAIDFLNSGRILRDINHKEITVVKNNDQGKTFSGFKGGVYLDIMMEEISSTSYVKVLSISNQVLGHRNKDNYTDFALPIIILRDKFVTEQDYGADAFVPAADAFDVLSDSSVTLSVKAPDGTTKIQNKDASVSQTFKLDQFGSYQVEYKGKDSAGNTATFRRKITVYDFNAPVITLNSGLKETYKLNEEVSIPSYTVTDNLNDYKLDVFLIMPSGEQRLLMTDKNGTVKSYLDAESMIYNSSFKVNSTTFKAEQYGKYTMRFVAYDSDYNKSVQELNFEVK